MWFRILLLLVFVVSIFWLPYFVDVVSRNYGFLRWSLKIQQLQIPPRSVGAQTSNDQQPRHMQELLILRGFFVHNLVGLSTVKHEALGLVVLEPA